VPFVLERSPLSRRGPQLHFEYLMELRKFLQWRTADAILLGEANVMPAQNRDYFGDEGDGMHMMFNFYVNQHLFYALASADTRPLQEALKQTKALPASAQWAHFLRNHDELDLDRLPRAQRDAVFARFGPTRKEQLYGRGIRRRLASMLGDRRHIELANSVMFSLPGAPVIRYGDEIGMGEDLALKERDAVRTPMQWSNERNAGFSTARRLVHPVIRDGVFGYPQVNVEDQRRDPGSLLNWMTRLIRARKECREIGWGEWELVRTGSPHVLGLCYSWRGRRVLVLHNFSAQPVEFRFMLSGNDSGLLSDVMATSDSRVAPDGKHHVMLPEYGYRWYRVGGLNYALHDHG
jgi:maltose alpha-D-glucosyltransferase/alpha-amylase